MELLQYGLDQKPALGLGYEVSEQCFGVARYSEASPAIGSFDFITCTGITIYNRSDQTGLLCHLYRYRSVNDLAELLISTIPANYARCDVEIMGSQTAVIQDLEQAFSIRSPKSLKVNPSLPSSKKDIVLRLENGKVLVLPASSVRRGRAFNSPGNIGKLITI